MTNICFLSAGYASPVSTRIMRLEEQSSVMRLEQKITVLDSPFVCFYGFPLSSKLNRTLKALSVQFTG